MKQTIKVVQATNKGGCNLKIQQVYLMEDSLIAIYRLRKSSGMSTAVMGSVSDTVDVEVEKELPVKRFEVSEITEQMFKKLTEALCLYNVHAQQSANANPQEKEPSKFSKMKV